MAWIGTAHDYERVLKTRNTVLRQVSDGALDRTRGEDLLSVYDQQLAEIGARVIAARRAFLEAVSGELTPAFAAITRTGLEASARYVVRSGAETVDEILARLRDARVKDFATGATHTSTALGSDS